VGCEVGVEVVGDAVGFCVGDDDGDAVGRKVLRAEGSNHICLEKYLTNIMKMNSEFLSQVVLTV